MNKIKTTPKIMLLLFFISGATALIYQVIWVRLFGMVFGVTAFATGTVLSSFMAGLALGSYYFGRFIEKNRNPLRVFAFLQAGIGIFGLVFPFLLSALTSLYGHVYHQFHVSFYLFSLIRFILAFGLLIIPTTLMGGTLPVISKFFIRKMKNLGWSISVLYGVNNAGALVGCCLVGYFLIKTIGIRASLYSASIINLLIAVVVLIIQKKQKDENKAAQNMDDTSEASLANESVSYPRHIIYIVMGVFAVEGIASLAYEVIWARILVFFLGSSVYAFTTIVATFIFGLALGGFLMARLVDGKKDLVGIFGLVEILIGISAVLVVPLLGRLYYVLEGVSGLFGKKSLFMVVTGEFVCSFLIMLIPAVLMGTVFPLAARIYTTNLKGIGKKMGNVGAVDTIGSVFGPFLAGFVLIPLVGLQKSVFWIALLNIMLGITLIVFNPAMKRLKKIIIPVVGFLAFLAIRIFVPVNEPLITYSGITKRTIPQRLLYYKEGIEDTVSVIETIEGLEMNKTRELYSDINQAISDSRWDLPSNSIIAHLPLLLHPDPKAALVIGYGMGGTSWSIIQHGVTVDAVELSPQVVETNRKGYFPNANFNVHDDPGLNLVVNDGRNHVLVTDRKYDMISVGIIHPVLNTGSASFYSTEFYELCKEILTEDGIVCQWLPLHHVLVNDFRMLVRTFVQAFPHTTIWYKYTPDFLILIGTPEKLSIDFRALRERMGVDRIERDLKRSSMSNVFDLLDSFMMDEDTVREYAGSGPMHSDYHPHIEFSTPMVRFVKDTTYANLLGISRYRKRVFPVLTNTGTTAEATETKDSLERYFLGTQRAIKAQLLHSLLRKTEAIREYRKALLINPDDMNTRYILECLEENEKSSFFILGEKKRQEGNVKEAIMLYIKALEVDPDYLVALNSLGVVYYELRQLEEALAVYNKIIKQYPDYAIGHYSIAAIYNDRGMFGKAKTSLKEALRLNPEFKEAETALKILDR